MLSSAAMAVRRGHAWTHGAGIAAGLGALLAVSLLLRTGALGTSLWTDEGISAGIAAHPASEIPALLRQDGSPPLYYLLLHVWMGIAGSSEAGLRGLSLLFALALVPAALACGWMLFGRRAGWIAAVLAAASSFLTAYAQEARMYTLVALLGLLAAAALVRGLGQRRARWSWGFAALLTLLLYTHNWALFFAAGALVATVVLHARPRDVVVAFGLAALLFAPWVPTLLFQARHTGAPWADQPPLHALAVALGLAAAGWLAAHLARDDDERQAVRALGAAGAVTLGLAWLAAHVQPMWADRYLAVVVGPVLLLGAMVLARTGSLGLAGLGALVVGWALQGAPAPKTNVAPATAGVSARLRPGDLVFAAQPELIPVLAHYLPARLRWVGALGPVEDPGVVDWRDALERLRRARPSTQARRLVDRVPAGSRLLLVVPHVEGKGAWRAPWTRLVARRSREWSVALGADTRLRRLGVLPPPAGPITRTGVTGALYERRPG